MRYFIEFSHDDPILEIREAIVKAQHDFSLDNANLTNLIVDYLPDNFRIVLELSNEGEIQNDAR